MILRKIQDELESVKMEITLFQKDNKQLKLLIELNKTIKEKQIFI